MTISHNVIGINCCRGCHAPLPAVDRRRRYCDRCREDAAPLVSVRAEPAIDISRAGRAAPCRCPRPKLYEEDGDIRCYSCGRDGRVLAQAA